MDEEGWLKALDALFKASGSTLVEWIFRPGHARAMEESAFTRMYGRVAHPDARRCQAALLVSPALHDLCARHRERMYSWTNR